MKYPTLEEVEAANREQLARWYRFLPTTNDDAKIAVINRVCDRFKALGSFTPDLSKKIGWKER